VGFDFSFGGVEAGEGAFLYPENGLRKFDFCFWVWFCCSPGMGLVARLVGRKLSSRTMTKFEGKRPIMRLSRLSLPIHHDPSPALRHSIRSPSTKPRSRSVSPPHEYTARHQQGNRVGRSGAVLAIVHGRWDYWLRGRHVEQDPNFTRLWSLQDTQRAPRQGDRSERCISCHELEKDNINHMPPSID
jgi:hypothetical protein